VRALGRHGSVLERGITFMHIPVPTARTKGSSTVTHAIIMLEKAFISQSCAV